MKKSLQGGLFQRRTRVKNYYIVKENDAFRVKVKEPMLEDQYIGSIVNMDFCKTLNEAKDAVNECIKYYQGRVNCDISGMSETVWSGNNLN